MYQIAQRVETNFSTPFGAKLLYSRCWDEEELRADDGSPEEANGMPEQDGAATCSIYLLGALAILGPDGAIYTPKAQKARALVALLALAPRGSRSRVWLRDKLWSESGEEQSSASLRQALTDVRRSLGDLADELLISDNHTVSLNLGRINVDALDPDVVSSGSHEADATPELLEGLDINDPEFEDWLALERQAWRSRLERSALQRQLIPKPAMPEPARAAAIPKSGTTGTTPAGGSNGWSVALMPPSIVGEPTGAGALPERFGALLVRTLLETGDVSVLDMSRGAEATAIKPVALIIEPRYRVAGDQVHLNVALIRNNDQTLLWMGGTTLDRGAVEHNDLAASYQFLNEAIDQLHAYFLARSQDGRAPTEGESLFGAINAMFRLSRGDLEASEVSLRRIIASRPSSQAYAWLSFLMTFRVGQRFTDWASTIEAAQQYGRKSLELDSSNAVSLALVGHVHSYLFGEYDFASSLLERAIRANPAQALTWDLYSMLQAYAGDPRKGLKMATWGRHLGNTSPYRYYFDTSRSINAALAGEYNIAIEAGESALAERPDFNSLLRYLVASHAHRGDMQAAQSFLDRLNVVEPNFSVGALIDARYPIIETQGGKHLIEGLLKAGVKK